MPRWCGRWWRERRFIGQSEGEGWSWVSLQDRFPQRLKPQ